MRSQLLLGTTLLALIASPRANADTIFSTTDLGTSYQLQTNAGGDAFAVVNGDGSVAYAFAKTPVTPLSEKIMGGAHLGDFTMYTLSNASGKVGYRQWDHGSLSQAIKFPTFEAWYGPWFTYASTWADPIADMNVKGQVVGKSDYFGAAFSDVNRQSHGSLSLIEAHVDDLNAYINPIPEVTLKSAFKIDDLGQILAQGSDGHTYLLRPLDLGPPQTVPEPTTLTMVVVVGFAVGVRSLRRRSA